MDLYDYIYTHTRIYIYIYYKFHDCYILNLSMIHDYINYKILISLYLESEAMPVLGKCVQGATQHR